MDYEYLCFRGRDSYNLDICFFFFFAFYLALKCIVIRAATTFLNTWSLSFVGMLWTLVRGIGIRGFWHSW